MSEDITLNIGGHALKLSKSERLVAVKPRPGMESGLERAVSALPDANATQSREILGGFRIVELGDSTEPTNDRLDILRQDPAVATASHVFHTSDDGVPFVPTGSLYIEFKAGTDDLARQELLSGCKLQIVEARDDGQTIIARTTAASPNPVKVAAALQASGKVGVCEPDLATPGRPMAFALPTDALLGDQWHLQNTGRHRGTTVGFKRGADARVVQAWQAGETLGSPEVVIAVIDDGFDLTHPDLAVPNKVVHPWDFTRNNNAPTPDPHSLDWHGTACAGVALGASGAIGILGVAPAATLMPLRWGRDLSGAQIEAWFDHARERGAWVVSCSWGAQAAVFVVPTRARRAIERCAREGRGGKGAVIVFAAGNEDRDVNDPTGGSLSGFAILPDVVAVAASTSMDERSDYSNFGDEIWICAPSSGAGGWGVLTADVTGQGVVAGNVEPLGYSTGDYTYDFGGTSSACPLVAGVCALMLSVNRDLTADEVRKILAETARKIGDPSLYTKGRSREFGHGCVDAHAALKGALDARPVAVASGEPTTAQTTAA